MIEVRCSKKSKLGYPRALSFGGFSDKNPATTDGFISVFPTTSLPAVSPEVSKAAEAIRTITPESDSVLNQVWWSLGFIGTLITEAYLSRVTDTSTPTTTTVLVLKPVTPIFTTSSLWVMCRLFESISSSQMQPAPL